MMDGDWRTWPVRPAGRFWGFVLNRAGFKAVATPWCRIYILPRYVSNRPLIEHEQTHAMQCQRDGAWYFWPKIIFDFFYHGYRASPYEIEAREAAGV